MDFKGLFRVADGAQIPSKLRGEEVKKLEDLVVKYFEKTQVSSTFVRNAFTFAYSHLGSENMTFEELMDVGYGNGDLMDGEVDIPKSMFHSEEEVDEAVDDYIKKRVFNGDEEEIEQWEVSGDGPAWSVKETKDEWHVELWEV